MASNHKNAYPHFVPNQLLKSSTLNGYFAFLDEQTRLSRVHFLGCGIVQGLEFSVTEDALVVNPGVAVNKDGWLVQVPEKAEYRYVVEVPFTSEGFQSSSLGDLVEHGGSRIARVCFQTEEDAEEFGKERSEIMPMADLTLDEFVVALAFGTRPEHAVRCAHDHCDLNTAYQILEAWPVLIPIEGQSGLFRKLEPIHWAASPKKEPSIEFFHGDIGLFNEQVRSSALSWKAEIDEALSCIRSHFATMSDAALSHLFGKSFSDELDGLDHARKMVQTMADDASRELPDYFISFCGDMVTALNEFIGEYNGFVDKYVIIPDVIPDDLLVYLGRPREDEREDRSIYRSMFRNALQEEFQRDSQRLSRMLWRLDGLASCFIDRESEQWLSQQAFQMEKVRPGDRLSNRLVPFYYKNIKEFVQDVWNADKVNAYGLDDRVAEHAFADRYLRSSSSMNDDGWFLYPRAYQGKELSAVKSELEALNADLRLSLDVIEAQLNRVERLTAPEAEALLQLLDSSGSAAGLFDEVRKKCSNNSEIFDLAGILGESLDVPLVESLRDGRPLTGNSYRNICGKGQIDAAGLADMTKAVIAVTKSNTNKAEALRSAFSRLIQAWKSSFITVPKGVLPEEIGKAVPLAPIKRGCRVVLFARPDVDPDGREITPTVLSYGVIYRNQEAIQEEVKKRVVFKLRTKAMENGAFAGDFSDTVSPFGDGNRWNIEDNKLCLYPFIYEGSSAREYETAVANIVCEIPESAKSILALDSISLEVSSPVPVIKLKMLGNNGTAWVNLKVKDGSSILCNKTVAINVDNPEWRRVPVSKVVLDETLSPVEIRKDQSYKLVAHVEPGDATDKGIEWKSMDSTIVKITSQSNTSCSFKSLKEGETQVVAASKSDPTVTSSVLVQVYSIDFASVFDTTKGAFLRELPDTFDPFNTRVDGMKMRVSSDVFSIYVRKNGAYYLGAKKEFDYAFVKNDADLTCDIVQVSGLKSFVYYFGMRSHKNGTSVVTLRIVKDGHVVDAKTLTINVFNPEWEKKPVNYIEFTESAPTLYVGQSWVLKRPADYRISPVDAGNPEVSWHSDPESVARFDDKKIGVLRALKAGASTITVKSVDNPEATATAQLTVYSLSLRAQLSNGNFEEISKTTVIDINKQSYAGGAKIKVFPFKSDGKKLMRMTTKEVYLVEDPSKRATGKKVVSGQLEEGGFPYAAIQLGKDASVVTLMICDATKGQSLYSQEVKVQGNKTK